MEEEEELHASKLSLQEFFGQKRGDPVRQKYNSNIKRYFSCWYLLVIEFNALFIIILTSGQSVSPFSVPNEHNPIHELRNERRARNLENLEMVQTVIIA